MAYIPKNEKLIELVKKQIIRLTSKGALDLIKLILAEQKIEIQVKEFAKNYKYIVQRNSKIIEEKNNKYYLSIIFINELKEKLLTVLKKKEQASIKTIEDEEEWTKKKIDGIDAYEVTQYTTFQDIREKLCDEGKDIEFKYRFNKPDLNIGSFKDKSNLQLVEAHITDSGQTFGYPLAYIYTCDQCGAKHERDEYKVASNTQNKINCDNLIESEDTKGNIKLKKCNNPLYPDKVRTLIKKSYIYNIVLIDENNEQEKSEAISFKPIPKGLTQVVVTKISKVYGGNMVLIVDYKEMEKNQLIIPEKNNYEHKIFTYIKTIDKYIYKNTRYKHYGYLPVKIATMIQFVARNLKPIKNNYHISLLGTRSSGKSYFARYWATALYAENSLITNATSISIPKLRGTMESFQLFGKDHRYQYRGLLGEKNLIVIDEVKENKDVKDNLKQYLLEDNYDYNKQGGNNLIYTRTAQLIVTQNADVKHLDNYAQKVRDNYYDITTQIPSKENPEQTIPKPRWEDSEDLTLPIHEYRNVYLRMAIKATRDEYERNQINWIDGSELALKQRFFFDFFLSSEKMTEELKETIKENSANNPTTDTIELIKTLGAENLARYFQEKEELLKGKNDLDYFDKVEEILKKYNKKIDARTLTMSNDIIRIIRIIDEREYCTEEDLKIFEYLISNIDNKIEIADTNEFKVKSLEVIQAEESKDLGMGSDIWKLE